MLTAANINIAAGYESRPRQHNLQMYSFFTAKFLSLEKPSDMGKIRLLTFGILLAVLLLSSPSPLRAHGDHHQSSEQAADIWKCPSCGYASNKGNFCIKCGAAKPGTWTCPSCGRRGNAGKFCPACGTAKPGTAANKVQTAPNPAEPADNGMYINVLKTDGSVGRHKLSGSPAVSFTGNQISVGGVSYEKSGVQRLEYGNATSGIKPSSDKPDDRQDAVFIYRHDGQVNAFEQDDIMKMSHEIADTLQVVLADSVYRIPIAAIDSIGIHPFQTVYKPDVVLLAPYIPYVESVSVENQSIKFSPSLPEEMRPKQGDILFYETFDKTFPDGYAGRVVTTDGYACTTEMVGIDDIYKRVIIFGTLTAARDFNTSKSAWSQGDDSAGSDKSELSIDLSELKISASRGPVSASLDLDIAPDFNVSIVKRDEYDAARISVDIKLDASAEVSLSVGGASDILDYLGPSISPVAKFVIPACPVFSVGLDLHPFITASVNGSISESAKFSSNFAASVTYCDGDVDFKPQFKVGITPGTPKVQAEGKVHVGALILPSVQITGGLWKIGPAFKIGPSVSATLDLDSGGLVNCGYDVLKDSKVTVAAEGCVEAEMRVLGKLVGDSVMPEFPFTIAARDWYFVPLFSSPTVSPARTENVGVSTTASRDVLAPVRIGIDILQDGKLFKTYANPEEFSADPVIMRQHFSGFKENVTYTAVPTLEIFGQHVQASPRTNFQVKDNVPEVRTEDAYNVMLNSATIEGSFPDFDNKYVEYGLQYAADGESTWHKKKNPKLNENDFFRANLSDLKQNTVYRFQAYLVYDGQTYYGEEKTFLTGIAPLEVNNPGGYRIEWRTYTFSHYDDVDEIHYDYGAYERKGATRTEYKKKEGKWVATWRYNDQSRTTAYYDSDHGKWVDPQYDEDKYPAVVEEIRRDRKALAARFGYTCYDDDFGKMSYYAEDFTRGLIQQGFDAESRKKFMDRNFLGTDTVCGVKCNVYAGVWNYGSMTWWIDPQTGLLLRTESDGVIFEVTRYEIDGYNFNK